MQNASYTTPEIAPIGGLENYADFLIDSDEEEVIDLQMNNSKIKYSQSTEKSVMNTQSVSSTASTKNSSLTNNDIKYVEEGIDYDKTPKPLIYLKISTLFLFTSIIVLASV